MGYATGIKWSYETIKEEIVNVMNALNINRMPTSIEIKLVTKNSKLINAIRRYGGFLYWANQLNLEQSSGTTRLGVNGEVKIKEVLESKGYKVEKMSVKHPYDLLVNSNIKIDVKTAMLYTSQYGNSYYTFNLEKKNPTCDIYIFYCIEVNKILIIPSKLLKQTQLSISENSKYNKYIDRWDYLELYDNFYKEVVWYGNVE